MTPKKFDERIVVAIDGPSGTGKSSVAKMVARRLKLPYLDTGAMYRAVTCLALLEGVSLQNPIALARLARRSQIQFHKTAKGIDGVIIDDRDVTREIRTPSLTSKVHYVAKVPAVRTELVKKQRMIGKELGGVVEGRDITTVVFPLTPHKFYLHANFKVRVKRRFDELIGRGMPVTMKEVGEDQKARDYRDSTRKVGALKRAKDAVYINTTSLTISQVAGKICQRVLGGGSGRK